MAAHVAIVQALWNREITDRLASGAAAAAEAAGATTERFEVAGAFELPAATRSLAESRRYDAVVPLGCLIRGETPHFQVLADAVAGGLMRLSLEMPAAIAFGVLTCDNVAQASARAGGNEGNKGAEAMAAALSVVRIRRRMASASARTEASARTTPARSTSVKRKRSPGRA